MYECIVLVKILRNSDPWSRISAKLIIMCNWHQGPKFEPDRIKGSSNLQTGVDWNLEGLALRLETVLVDQANAHQLHLHHHYYYFEAQLVLYRVLNSNAPNKKEKKEHDTKMIQTPFRRMMTKIIESIQSFCICFTEKRFP